MVKILCFFESKNSVLLNGVEPGLIVMDALPGSLLTRRTNNFQTTGIHLHCTSILLTNRSGISSHSEMHLEIHAFFSPSRLPYTRSMIEDLSFPPGLQPADQGPLARFLPPLESGSTVGALKALADDVELILDPFGVSPRLVVECAAAGKAVITGMNNPVTRFVLRHQAQPFSGSQLKAGLARLGSAPKDNRRLEPFLLDLYLTSCSNCQSGVSADYFIWDREQPFPLLRGYVCPRCSHVAEEPTTEEDHDLARQFSHSGLQYAMALEQIAPIDDPFREHAQAALAVYPSRSLFALITAVSKLEQMNLSAEEAAPLHALLLSAFDASNSLWGYPDGRARPKQLSASPRFREPNVWRALERAVDDWRVSGPAVQLQDWPGDGVPERGSIAVYPGSVRELVSTLPEKFNPYLFTVIPRPNQAYWTLTALWASWLWGKDTAASIKVALRRRRYDWNWFAAALDAVLSPLNQAFPEGVTGLTFLPEAEAGFIAASLAGFEKAGFNLTGRALRSADGQAIFSWNGKPQTKTNDDTFDLRASLRSSALNILIKAAEPLPYLTIHTAAWTELASHHQLDSAWHGKTASLSSISSLLDQVLSDHRSFQNLGGSIDPEHGIFWSEHGGLSHEALSDRVECFILGKLRRLTQVDESEIINEVFEEFRGLISPDYRIIRACLVSYANETGVDGGWALNPDDEEQARVLDCDEVSVQLIQLGKRLDYEVRSNGSIDWIENKRIVYRYRVQASALMSRLFSTEDMVPLTIVLPGGRAGLVAEKQRHDPRLREVGQQASRILKFRHIRRLLAESTLTRQNFSERMKIDPPENQDPQLPLL
jgi:hypothetical protein